MPDWHKKKENQNKSSPFIYFFSDSPFHNQISREKTTFLAFLFINIEETCRWDSAIQASVEETDVLGHAAQKARF